MPNAYTAVAVSMLSVEKWLLLTIVPVESLGTVGLTSVLVCGVVLVAAIVTVLLAGAL